MQPDCEARPRSRKLAAATLAVGLAGSATAYAPAGNSVNAQAGYMAVYYLADSNSAAQAIGQGAGLGAL